MVVIGLVNHGVLIAEGYTPVALSVLRSLGQKGISTALLSSFPYYISRFSKYCQKQFLVPSLGREKEYAKAVAKIVRKMEFAALFPIYEWSLIPVSKNRDKLLPYVQLPIASHESILKCFDKLSTINLAIEKGVPIPQTCFVHNLAELKRVSEEVTYPVVVKPRWSIVWRDDRAFHRRGVLVTSAAELIAAYNSINKYFPHPLIQEYVPGTNYSLAALYNRGKPRAFCCIKVHRAWPPLGGNSCFRESVPIDLKMREYAEKLLGALNWHGIAEVEFRLDSRDDVPKLMEINPRFWGSLSVAVKAGVDFPYLLYRMIMDGDVPKVSFYKSGVKGRYIEQDLLHIFNLFKSGSFNPGAYAQKRFRMLLNLLKIYEPGVFYDLLDLRDPLPFFFSSALFPLGLMRHLREPMYAWAPAGVRM